MKSKFLAVLALVVVVLSCNKEKTSGGAADLEGNYTFKFLSAETYSMLTASDGEKIVNSMNYTSTENKGTMVLSSSTAKTSDLGYSVNTTEKYSYYEGNELTDSSTNPFVITIPPTSSTAAYKLVGSDSIYFPQGGFMSGLGSPGSSTPFGPSGARYNVDGNTLTFFLTFYRDSSYVESGYTFHEIQSLIGKVVMEKQ